MEEVSHERLKSPIPTIELERRWKLLQEAMKEAKLDCILTQNTTQYMGGYNRWLTDTTAENAYPQSAIIPAEGKLALIAYGAPPQNYYPPKFAVRGGTVLRNVPYFAPFNFTHDWEGMLAVEWLQAHKIKTLGIAGMGFIHSAYYDYLKKQMPELDIIDATDLVDNIRSIKSEEEIKFIRKSAAIQDKAFGYVAAIAHPGVREYEIRSKLMEILTDLGGEEQIVVIGSSSQKEAFTPYPSFMQNRILEAGDQMYVGISSSGSGGFFTALGRMFSLGQPSPEMEANWQHTLRAQEKLISQLNDGAVPAAIYRSYNHYLKECGFRIEDAIFAYGQGYDFIERPSIEPEEMMVIRNNMCMAVNTRVVTPERTSYCCDSILISDQGNEMLHKTKREIIIL